MAGVQVSKADLAHIFGVDQPTIDNWIRMGLPHMRRRRTGTGNEFFERELIFDTADAINWRILQDQLGQES